MHTAKVFTNLTCNQSCTYCNSRRPTEDPSFIRPAVTRARIDTALADGVRELVLTGGEPLLRKDLEALIRHARDRGAVSVVIETNGTLVDEERARSLRDAGLDCARVNLAGASAALDEVTRDPGGFERADAGLRALSEAGIRIEIAVALVRSTLSLVPRIPALLASMSSSVKGIVLSVPVESPNSSELVSYEEAIPVILRIDATARAHGIPVRLSPENSPPPCVFPPRGKSAHLFSLTPGATLRADFVKLSPCASCVVADRCAGFSRAYLARHADPPMHPIVEDRVRRRLSLVSNVDEQIRRELVTMNRQLRASGPDEALGAKTQSPTLEHVIRVNFHCNQACRFCFVSTHLPPAKSDEVADAIREAGRQGARIVLSGGEPTLNPKLAQYVRLAKEVSRLPIELQTNAILLDDADRAEELAALGLDDVFVSLHGATADTSDAVTDAPGTFARTVVGIDNLSRTSMRLILNYVLCQTNYRELVPYVGMVAARWPKAVVNISFVAPSTDVVPRDTKLIPRYQDVLPHVAGALAEGRRLGVEVVGFESMCGIPLCLVPKSLEQYFDIVTIPDGFDGGEFLKPGACRECALESKCFGIRRGYAELYGTSELRSVPEPDAAFRGPA